MRRALVLPLVLWLGCSGGSSSPDATVSADSGALPDSGSEARDAGGFPDALAEDLGAGLPDAAPLADAAEPVDAEVSDSGVCLPSGPEVCDHLDNDCNGLIDDIDVGHDGIFDCLRIAIIGAPGARPASNFLAWLMQQGTTVTRIHTTATATLSAAEIGGYDVLLLDQLVRAYTPDEATTLASWVQRGGGLVVLSGYTGAATDYSRPNDLLATLNLTIRPGLYSGPVTSFIPHATTASITTMTFSGGYNVSAVGSSTVNPISLEVARLSSGPVAIAALRGEGRVFLWGDEWIEFDSEWQTLNVAQFWANILGWVSHARR
ncbi:MAG: DUF4350 domain-containing protein [Myxococcota bacterium]